MAKRKHKCTIPELAKLRVESQLGLKEREKKMAIGKFAYKTTRLITDLPNP